MDAFPLYYCFVGAMSERLPSKRAMLFVFLLERQKYLVYSVILSKH